LDEGACTEFLPIRAKGPFTGASAVATEDPFSVPNPRKFMTAKVPVKVTEIGEGAAFFLAMGTWWDNGNGVPEPSDDDPETDTDEYACQPPYTTALKIKGGGPVR
jgi:hypothetical protein